MSRAVVPRRLRALHAVQCRYAAKLGELGLVGNAEAATRSAHELAVMMSKFAAGLADSDLIARWSSESSS